MIYATGATSVSVDVFFADDAGAALTGKLAADFPACKWSAGNNTASTTITLSDLAAITTAHPNDNTAGGIKEREGGWYRLDLPNNVFTAAGMKRLTFAETANKRILAPAIEVGAKVDVDTIKTGTIAHAGGTVTFPNGTIGTSTLTQTQVTGGAYALNSASFAFDAALDFTTTQKAATLARVTLVDTTTTNTDMRGTDNAALAATALSTANWTNALATNLGTTNTTVATNLDATVSSRSTLTQAQVTGGAYAINSASFAFDAALDLTTTQKASVNTEADAALVDIHLDHLLAATYDPAAKPGAADALLNEIVGNDAGVSQFTANALELAPSGGLDAAGVRAAVGLATANLDTQLADVPAIKTKTDFLPSATAGAAGGVFIAGSNAATTVATWTSTGASTNGSTVLGNVTAGTITTSGTVTFNALTVSAGTTLTGAVTSTHASNDVRGITVSTNSDKSGYSLTAGTGLGNQTSNITGNLSGSVGSVTGNVGGNVVGSVASVIGAVGSVTGAVGSVTGNVGGNVVGSVGSVVAAVATTSNIKKNQALAAFQFAMLDDTTKLPVTGKTVTVTRSIDGGAFAAGTLSAVTELSNGLYGVDFGAGDLNGNVIVLRATATGCDDTFERIVTQP